MQKKIDEQMEREGLEMDKNFKSKKEQLIHDKKKALEDRVKEMGEMSDVYAAQIMKQYELELSQLEKAIRDERDY